MGIFFPVKRKNVKWGSYGRRRTTVKDRNFSINNLGKWKDVKWVSALIFRKHLYTPAKLNQFFCYKNFLRFWLNWGQYLASIYSSKIEPLFPLHGFFAILTQLRLIYNIYMQQQMSHWCVSFGFKISVHIWIVLANWQFVPSDSRLLAINVLHEKKERKKRKKIFGFDQD